MVINKRIITLTLVGLIAQPALASNKAMRLAQIAKNVGQETTVVGKFLKDSGFKASKGWYPAEASMATRSKFTSLVPVKPVLNPVILESEAVTADAIAFNAELRELYTNVMPTGELLKLTASKYGQLTQATLANVRQAIGDYADIIRCSAKTFGEQIIAHEARLTKTEMDALVATLKAARLAFKDTVKFTTRNIKAENQDVVTYVINPFVRNFNQVTKEAIETFELTGYSEAAYASLVQALNGAVNRLTTSLNQVSAVAQKTAIDFAALTRQYVAQGAEYASQNPKSAHGIFAATVAAATAATMANEIGKEKMDKKARLQQSIALDQTRQAEFDAALPMIQQQVELNRMAAELKAKEIALLQEATKELEILQALEKQASTIDTEVQEANRVMAETIKREEAQKAALATKNSSSWLRQARQTTSNWASQVSNWWYKGAKTPNAQS